MRWKDQFLGTQNLIAYSNQPDELILDIYMTWSNLAILGGKNPLKWAFVIFEFPKIHNIKDFFLEWSFLRLENLEI